MRIARPTVPPLAGLRLFRPVSLIALVKDRWGLGRFTRSQHETAYLLAKGRPAFPNSAISDVVVWRQSSPLFHPTQKPLGAIAKLISTFAPPSATILDPFSGSGTTLVAARALGHRATGIEIDEYFCEVTATRLSQQILNLADSPPTLSDRLPGRSSSQVFE